MSEEQNNIAGAERAVTNGEIAYNAYCNASGWKSLASGADLPQFADTTPEIQAAWESAAQAVLDFNTSPVKAAA